MSMRFFKLLAMIAESSKGGILVPKIITGLEKEKQEKEVFEKEQSQLHRKHNIKDDNVIVVEKTNMTKFTIKMAVRFIKLIATIFLLILAVIGLTTLIYPETREAFTGIFMQTVEQTEQLVKGETSL